MCWVAGPHIVLLLTCHFFSQKLGAQNGRSNGVHLMEIHTASPKGSPILITVLYVTIALGAVTGVLYFQKLSLRKQTWHYNFSFHHRADRVGDLLGQVTLVKFCSKSKHLEATQKWCSVCRTLWQFCGRSSLGSEHTPCHIAGTEGPHICWHQQRLYWRYHPWFWLRFAHDLCVTDFFPYDFCDVNLCVDCFYFGSRITHGLIFVHFWCHLS